LWAKAGKDSGSTYSTTTKWTKFPQLYRSGVIVGQKRLHLTRMAHNAENKPTEYGAKFDKVPQ